MVYYTLKFFLYIIIIYFKFIQIINRNYQIINNGLTNIFQVFWQLIISNIQRSIISKSRKKIYYYIFFKDFFNKFGLIIEIKKVNFVNLRYKE